MTALKKIGVIHKISLMWGIGYEGIAGKKDADLLLNKGGETVFYGFFFAVRKYYLRENIRQWDIKQK